MPGPAFSVYHVRRFTNRPPAEHTANFQVKQLNLLKGVRNGTDRVDGAVVSLRRCERLAILRAHFAVGTSPAPGSRCLHTMQLLAVCEAIRSAALVPTPALRACLRWRARGPPPVCNDSVVSDRWTRAYWYQHNPCSSVAFLGTTSSSPRTVMIAAVLQDCTQVPGESIQN